MTSQVYRQDARSSGFREASSGCKVWLMAVHVKWTEWSILTLGIASESILTLYISQGIFY